MFESSITQVAGIVNLLWRILFLFQDSFYLSIISTAFAVSVEVLSKAKAAYRSLWLIYPFFQKELLDFFIELYILSV